MDSLESTPTVAKKRPIKGNKHTVGTKGQIKEKFFTKIYRRKVNIIITNYINRGWKNYLKKIVYGHKVNTYK